MKNVTIIMHTYNNIDFTRASIAAIRSFYPDIPVILADGGSDEFPTDMHNRVVYVVDGTYEECANAAVSLVETEYFINMNQNVRLMGHAIEPLVEVMDWDVACTGAYCVKVLDYDKREALCGIRFSKSVDVDAVSGYFSLHNTSHFREIGGYPHAHKFYKVPLDFDPRVECASDLSICKLYRERNLRVMSPATTIPVLHWPRASKPTEYREWWVENTNHKHADFETFQDA